MLLSNRLSFVEDPESLSARSWDRFMIGSRRRKPGLWRLHDSAMSGRSAENDSSLHQPRSFVAQRHSREAPAECEVTAGEMEEGVGLKAVSQLLWPDRDREVPGFPVKFVGVDKLHAAFLKESRTRGRCLVPRTGNPGVWFSLEENHERAYHFGLHRLRNCPGVVTFICGVPGFPAARH
jgi:hypothetical protein